MFDLIVQDHHTDRDILLHILKGLHAMALDLSKLNAAVDRNTKAVDALVATHTDPATQAAVDLAAQTIDAASAKAEAAVAPAAG